MDFSALKKITLWPMDRRTDGQTDKVSQNVALHVTKKKIWRTNVKSTTAFLHWLCKQRKESSEMIFSKSVMTALKTQHNWVLVSINSIESSVYHFKWSFEGCVRGCKCSELSFILLNTCASSLHNKYDRKSYRNSYAAAYPSLQFLI